MISKLADGNSEVMCVAHVYDGKRITNYYSDIPIFNLLAQAFPLGNGN